MKYLIKRYLAVIYELLLMLALTLALTAAYVLLVGDASHGWKRLGLQGLLWLVMGAYFVRCWVVSGQTLASQTWKFKVVSADGRLLDLPHAMMRYVLAGVLLLPAGLTLWWALLDREQQFLHDRLLGSRIIVLPSAK
ncbi:RDD family protein [Methylophilus medardicus]|uniref:RDD family protein n=1 Tax=Methylophilus medardicus TaxID=2588534 RepID=A0A5B8CPZ3_9PROT|nr:RDD family protein [Methylophilus medardicus]QDC43279.1 RDD family protein [Methylophilus medardicus]QDC48286.1 RDD family protein [Methylophilus medardicus]QDC51991.1 RDD family protein [Methylophilus medardicus]